MKNSLVILLLLARTNLSAQNLPVEQLHGVAPLWEEFVEAKKAGKTPILPDFSYAGYHFSEREIPSVTNKKYFKVTDFGAVPNDNKFDDEAIQKNHSCG